MYKQVIKATLVVALVASTSAAASAQTFFNAQVSGYLPSVIHNYDAVAPMLRNNVEMQIQNEQPAVCLKKEKGQRGKFFKRFHKKSYQLADK